MGKIFSSNAGLNNMNVIGKPLNGIYAFRTAGYYNSMDEVPCYYIDGKYTPLRTLKNTVLQAGRSGYRGCGREWPDRGKFDGRGS